MDPHPPKVILLALSEAPEQRFARLLLAGAGAFRVMEAKNTAELLQKLKGQPDLILVDPRMDGVLRAVQVLRRMPKLNHVSIVLVSGDRALLERFSGAGINGVIAKPFTPEVLLASVWKVLDAAPPVPGDGRPAEMPVDVGGIEGLPTLPTVYAQVEQVFKDPEVDAADAARVIEADPSITMKLLKLSNSAFFGFRREVKTVRDAVSLLGNQTVKNAVLSIAVFEAMKETPEGAGLDRAQFWRHATGVGSVARFVASRTKIEREEAFTAGILHDVGKVVLDGLFADHYAEVMGMVRNDNVSIFEAEETGGATHTRIGQELATSWKIPKGLVEVIAHHHAPRRAEADPELVCLVHVGDATARNLSCGSGGDPLVPVIDPFVWTRIGITPQDLTTWEDDMGREIEKDMSFLSAIA